MPAIIHFTFSSIVITSTSMWVLTVCSYQSADVTELHPVTDSCSLPPKYSAHNCNPCLLSSTCLLQYIPNNSALVMSFPHCPHSQPLPSFPPPSAEMHNHAQNPVCTALFVLFAKPGLPFSWHKQILYILQGLHYHPSYNFNLTT